MAQPGLYDLTQLEVNDEDVLDEVGGKQNWTALASALETHVSYDFVTSIPVEYMDFR